MTNRTRPDLAAKSTRFAQIMRDKYYGIALTDANIKILISTLS